MSGALLAIMDLVHANTGIRYDEAHTRSLESAIARASGGATPAEFLERLSDREQSAQSLRRLVDEVTIKETSFLRDARQLATIPWDRLLTVASGVGDDNVRIWSAACATGEEPYTLAMLACEAFGTMQPPVSILGTDIAESAVERAQSARYNRRSIAQLDEDLRARYLKAIDANTWEVCEPARNLVQLRMHNLVHDEPPLPGRFDLVLCRNVLIYFDDLTIEHVLATLEGALRPGGLLMLGAADALSTSPQRLARLMGHDRAAGSETAESNHASRKPRPVWRRPLVTRAVDRGSPSDELTLALQAAGDGLVDTAIGIASDVIARDPKNPEAQFVVGLIELERDRPVAAMRSFRRALHIQPAFSLAAFQLGRAADMVANEGAARSAYEQALRTAGSPEDASRLPWSIAPEDLASACRARLEELT